MRDDQTPKLMIIVVAAILLYVFAHVFVRMQRDECIFRADNKWRYKFSGLECAPPDGMNSSPDINRDNKKRENPLGIINPNAGQDL